MHFRLPAALFLAFAAPVPAEPGPADAGVAAPAESPKPLAAEKVRASVHLRDGGLVHGTVKRLRLGKSITLSLQSGKSITLDDSDIVEITLSGGAAPADGGQADMFPEQAVTAPKSSKRAADKSAPDAGTATLASRPPPLQTAPASDLDTVYLQDGSLLRGTIESEKPDLVLRLLSGRKRTLAAKDVKSIVRHGSPPTADRAKKP